VGFEFALERAGYYQIISTRFKKRRLAPPQSKSTSSLSAERCHPSQSREHGHDGRGTLSGGVPIQISTLLYMADSTLKCHKPAMGIHQDECTHRNVRLSNQGFPQDKRILWAGFSLSKIPLTPAGRPYKRKTHSQAPVLPGHLIS